MAQEVVARSSGVPRATTAAAVASTSAVAAVAAKDACQLLTVDAARTAIGGEVGPPKANSPKSGGTSCTYTETPFAVDAGLVTVTVFSPAVTYGILSPRFTNVQPITGVGDDGFTAFMDDTAGGNAGFRSGATVVMFNLGAKGPATAIPGKLRAFAAAVAGRL